MVLRRWGLRRRRESMLNVSGGHLLANRRMTDGRVADTASLLARSLPVGPITLRPNAPLPADLRTVFRLSVIRDSRRHSCPRRRRLRLSRFRGQPSIRRTTLPEPRTVRIRTHRYPPDRPVPRRSTLQTDYSSEFRRSRRIGFRRDRVLCG